ncbi:unnamed protein product [Scytosiphon promiscuus]
MVPRRPQSHREPALLDVTKSLTLPCDRSDVLLPRLHDALRSAFGRAGASAAAAAATDAPAAFTTDTLPPLVAPLATGAEALSAGSTATTGPGEKSISSGDGRRHLAPPTTESEGARWLRDWETKEIALDCERLQDVLGGAGLCGFAGWLLEYPVVYCCPSRLGATDGDVQAEGGDGQGGHTMGNCLAGVPLTVYSITIDFGDEPAGCRRRSHQGSSTSAGDATGERFFEAFSFSVPETLCGSAEDAEHDEEGACERGGVCKEEAASETRRRQRVDGLHGLVDRFLERLERRIARHRAGGHGDHHKLTLAVSTRLETLDRVAL